MPVPQKGGGLKLQDFSTPLDPSLQFEHSLTTRAELEAAEDGLEDVGDVKVDLQGAKDVLLFRELVLLVADQHLGVDSQCLGKRKELQVRISRFLSFFRRIVLFAVTGYPLKLRFQIPCVFPVRPQIFSVICDLADLSSFKIDLEIFAANIEIPFTSRIREFTT